jgi:hypothetical protein
MAVTINASTSAGAVTTADTSGILQLQTNGTAALTVNASQNVGIGTASPSEKLTLGGSANMYMSLISTGAIKTQIKAADSNGYGGVGTVSNHAFAIDTNNTERMRIDSSGNLLIGQTTSATNVRGVTINATQQGVISRNGLAEYNELGVWAGTSNEVKAQFQAKETGTVLIGSRTNTILALTVNDTERVRIDTGGSLFINCTTSPTINGTGAGGIGLKVTGGDAINLKHESNGSNTFNIWQTGTSAFNALSFNKGSTQVGVGNINCTTTGTSFNTTSDYRLKEAITPMIGALAKVALLKPCTYKWNVDGSDGQGFIAHELADVVPQCVTGEKDAVNAEGNPEYQGIDTSFLVATLTAAIQELKAIVDGQAALIAAQGAEIAALKGATA